MATPFSTSYVLLVVALSRMFLNETISWMKLSGIVWPLREWRCYHGNKN